MAARTSLPSASLLALALPLAFAGCGDCDDCDDHEPPPAHYVSITVEVYDPATNLVWENVSVRVLEADQEWSGCTCVSPFTLSELTDETGQVLLDEFDLSDAQVGFLEDGNGAAIIGPQAFEDEATVWIVVEATGFTPVLVGVPVTWSTSDVFVAVPFQ